MTSLLRVLLDIALWRRGPRDLPADPLLFVAIAGAYLLTSALDAFVNYGSEQMALAACLDLGLALLLYGLALALRGRAHRFQQTLAAILGCGVLFAVPTLVLDLALQRPGAKDNPLTFLVAIAGLTTVVWYVMVVGHVLREALDLRQWQGTALAVGCVIARYLIFGRLLGIPGI